MGAAVLHNFAMTHESSYNPNNFSDCIGPDGKIKPGIWRQDPEAIDNTLYTMKKCRGRKIGHEAKNMRDRIADWCVEEGVVSWQNNMV